MSTVAKQETVKRLRSLLYSSGVVILSHNNGLSVSAANAIRRSVKRDASGHYFVVKNTLMKIAIKGTKYESLGAMLTGPVVVTCGNDVILTAKTIFGFCKGESKLQLLGGAIAGEALSLERIKVLAALPSFDELRAKLLSILQAPGSQIARAISLYAEKKGS